MDQKSVMMVTKHLKYMYKKFKRNNMKVKDRQYNKLLARLSSKAVRRFSKQELERNDQ